MRKGIPRFLPEKQNRDSSCVHLQSVDDISTQINAFLSENLQQTVHMQNEIQKVVNEVTKVFNARIEELQTLCRDLTKTQQQDRGDFENKVQALEERLCHLETQQNRQQAEANLIVSGVREFGYLTAYPAETAYLNFQNRELSNECEDESVTQNVLRSTFDVKVNDGNITDCQRLGKQPMGPRPRNRLVRTALKQVREKIMAARPNPSVRTAKVYLNPYLTTSKQRSRRELLPVYGVLRKIRLPCRLHRGALVINNNVFYKSVPAQKYALDKVSVSDSETREKFFWQLNKFVLQGLPV